MKKYNLNFLTQTILLLIKKIKKLENLKQNQNRISRSFKKLRYRTFNCNSKKIIKKNYFVTFKQKKIFIYGFKSLKKKKIFSVNKYLSYWRYLENSLSSSIKQELLDALGFTICRKNNFFKSVYYVLRLSYYAFIKKLNIYKTNG